MTSINDRDQDFNRRLAAGEVLQAFDEFYADSVEMQENLDAPMVGKDANRAREQGFWGSMKELHAMELLGAAVNGDTSYSEWRVDVTLGNGYRMQMTQVARRRWKDGKIVSERFYYNPNPPKTA